jgi:protein involved in polysaccharide export with SLBB domain
VAEVQETVLLEAAVYGKPAEPDKPRVIPDRPVVMEVPHAPGISVLSLLDAFGGPTPLAEADKSIIYRGEDRAEIRFDAGELWKSRDPALDRDLEPGDHLFMPMKKLSVVVAGEVYDPGAYPYLTGGQVSDYIGLAGGAVPETASLKRIFLVDEAGQREPVTLTSPVPPASTLFVDKNPWKRSTYVLNETGIVIGFASSMIALITALLELIALF